MIKFDIVIRIFFLRIFAFLFGMPSFRTFILLELCLCLEVYRKATFKFRFYRTNHKNSLELFIYLSYNIFLIIYNILKFTFDEEGKEMERKKSKKMKEIVNNETKGRK